MPRLTIEEMQHIASERGGKCLSNEYINNQTKLQWQCRNGHIWEATPGLVKHGTWCPICAGTKLLTIEEMQRIASERGGKCLSTKYINAMTKLKWQCKKGHIWETIPESVRQGHWCSICGWTGGKKPLTIGEMQEIATSRGGNCLSSKYINGKTKLKWQCKKGHIWESKPEVIKQGSWCPTCARKITNLTS